MSKTIEAIYEDGVLRPLERLDIAERKRVKIAIFDPEALSEKMLDPVKKMIEHLKGPLPIRSLKELAQDTEIDAD